MSSKYNGCRSQKELRSIFAERIKLGNEEIAFCTDDNLESSLDALSEEFESFGIVPVTIGDKLQTLESYKELSIKVINAAWCFIHKHRSLIQLHNELCDSNHRTLNDNVNLKNHVKRLKENVQKKEYALCEAQERERRLKTQFETASHDLKREKEEVKKLKKKSQSKDIQHEHEIRRIMQNGQKLQEQLQKTIGTFVPRDKVLQKLREDHEREVTSYRDTICRLQENNRQMLEEINELRETLALHSDNDAS